MNTTTVGISALAILAIGVLALGSGAQAPGARGAGAVGVLAAETALYDFGTISMKDGDVGYTFTVTNPTDESVSLSQIVTSCMCTTAFLRGGAVEKGPFGMPGHGGPTRPADEVIGAGETRDIEVVYDPNAHGPAGVGRIERDIYLTDDAGRVLTLTIRANVTP
jgi:hypothetical protein